MDLKHFENVLILHLIDHASRFSAAATIKSKHKEVIIEQIFRIWISIFWTSSNHFSDNGGEFNNEELLLQKHQGLCERHHGVLVCVNVTMEYWFV